MSSMRNRGKAVFCDAPMRAVRMGQLAMVRRDPAWVSRDVPSGGWRHRYRGGTFVSPRIRGIPWRLAEQKTADIFFHTYTPRPGDVVVELGAEYGTETVTLARLVGPTGLVVAVEAHPRTCRLLRRTVELNGLPNVEVVNAAVSGDVGTLTISDGATVSNTVITGQPGLQVPATTVDALVERYALERIDLLKMNIEGSEREAMAGIHRSYPLVRHAVISCHDFRADAGDGEEFRTSAAVEQALSAWGFTVLRRRDDPRPWVREYRYASAPSDPASLIESSTDWRADTF
jgi:FkbM family methyltransferase